MPYIICVNRPGYLPESDPTAVATLAEAKDLALNITMGQRDIPKDRRAIAEMAESGGVIGPMPDGFVIDVQVKTWSELRDLAGMSTLVDAFPAGDRHERIIDAYNNGA